MQKTKVLIIDDEPDLCLLLKAYFSRKNCEVYISHSLETGLDHLESILPQILFLDNNLPDGTGWAHAPALANRYPNMEIAMISAFHPNRPEMPEHARFTILEKPISFSDLDKHIDLPQQGL